MDGRKFFQVLLDSRSLNPHALAQKLQKPSLQSSLQRYLEGKTSEPRRSTFEPIAQFFGVAVDGFFNSEIANQELFRLGLMRENLTDAISPRTRNPDSSQSATSPSLAETLTQLGEVIAASDELTRDQLKPLFKRMLDEPQRAPEIIKRIESTINSSGSAAAATNVGHKEIPGFLKR